MIFQVIFTFSRVSSSPAALVRRKSTWTWRSARVRSWVSPERPMSTKGAYEVSPTTLVSLTFFQPDSPL